MGRMAVAGSGKEFIFSLQSEKGKMKKTNGKVRKPDEGCVRCPGCVSSPSACPPRTPGNLHMSLCGLPMCEGFFGASPRGAELCTGVGTNVEVAHEHRRGVA